MMSILMKIWAIVLSINQLNNSMKQKTANTTSKMKMGRWFYTIKTTSTAGKVLDDLIVSGHLFNDNYKLNGV